MGDVGTERHGYLFYRHRCVDAEQHGHEGQIQAGKSCVITAGDYIRVLGHDDFQGKRIPLLPVLVT